MNSLNQKLKYKIILLLLVLIFLLGCVHNSHQPKEVILKFESEIPIEISIYKSKSCKGNWNFCDVDNYNFKKWDAN